MSSPAQFYYDYEIKPQVETQNVSYDLPDATIITSFPTSHAGGAYIQSYTPAFGGNSFDSDYFATTSYSLDQSSLSIDQNGKLSFDSFPSLSQSLDPFSDKNKSSFMETIETDEVNLFWQRYNEYPQYLKRLKKRTKNKERKAKKMHRLMDK